MASNIYIHWYEIHSHIHIPIKKSRAAKLLFSVFLLDATLKHIGQDLRMALQFLPPARLSDNLPTIGHDELERDITEIYMLVSLGSQHTLHGQIYINYFKSIFFPFPLKLSYLITRVSHFHINHQPLPNLDVGTNPASHTLHPGEQQLRRRHASHGPHQHPNQQAAELHEAGHVAVLLQHVHTRQTGLQILAPSTSM